MAFELTLLNSGPDDGQEVQLSLLPVGDGLYVGGPNVPAGGSPLFQMTIPLVPAGQSITIVFEFLLTGLPATDLFLTAQVASPGQPALESSYTLPVVRPAIEQVRVGQGEQLDPKEGQNGLTLLDSRLTLGNWGEGPATLQATLHEWHDDSTGRVISFDLNANRLDGSPIITLTTPIQSSLDLSDLLPTTALHLLTRENESQAWSEIAFSQSNGVLAFTLEHFSQFQVTSDPDPQSWLPTYNPPGVSAFTGSAGYGYAISLPPGYGGLQPELSLSYGSRSVDSKAYPVQGSLGWSLSTIEISNGNTGRMFAPNGCEMGCNVYESVWYNLVLNGVSYRLAPTTGLSQLTGLYKAVGEPSLRVELLEDLNATNRTGLYWLIQTADGTKYRLGYLDESELAVGPMAFHPQPRYGDFMAATWKIDQIVDGYGRQINFFYDEACGTSGSYCRNINGDPVTDGDEYQMVEVDLALKRIEYNFSGGLAQTVVNITNSGQNNSLRGQPSVMLVNHFRPDTLTIQHNGNTFARHELGYQMVSHAFDYPSGTKLSWHWWLTNITPYGQSGTVALPATTFVYNQPTAIADITLLSRVHNGYGGVTQMAYGPVIDRGDDGHYFYATSLSSWDGVAYVWGQHVAKTVTAYSYDPAKACYDEVMSEGIDCKAPAGNSAGSHALVGFSEVTSHFQDGLGATLARQWQKFNVAAYQLNGKVIENKQLDPATNAILTWDLFAWQWTGSQARQTEEHHHRYGSTGGDLYTYATNTYYDGAGHYGGLYRQTSNWGDGTAFKCTEYAYGHQTNSVWLINRPLRQTTFSGVCGSGGSKVAESLYRYTGTTIPTDTGLYGKAQLAWTLTWAGGSNYVAQRTRYNSNNLVEWQDSFASYATPSAYPTVARSALHTSSYNSLGLPLNQDSTTGSSFSVIWSEQLSYQPAFPWLPASYTNPQGLTASYSFDGYGRLSSVTKAGANHVSVQYQYNLASIPLWISTTIEPNTSLEQKSTTYYNGLGQAIQTTSANHLVEINNQDSSRDIISQTGFDALGRQSCQSTPFAVAVNSGFIATPCQSQSEKTMTEYDAVGRVRKVTPPSGVPLYTYYNVLEGFPAGDFQQTVTAVDENGQAVRQVLDGFGRPVGVIEYSGTNPSYTVYATTIYSYDVLGNLLNVTDEQGNSTSLTYDTLGHKTDMTDPDMGHWVYTYDQYGNLLTQTDAKGQKICFTYDALNRLTEKRHDTTPTTPCPTNAASILSRTIYGTTGSATGQVVEIQWGNNSSQNRETFSYDSLGRLSVHQRWVDNRAYAMAYTNYDGLNRPTTIIYPNGQTRTISYDKEGENSLTNSGATLISNLRYNAQGQLTFLDRTWGGVDTTYTYHPATDQSGGGLGDNNYRLATIRHGNSGSDSWSDFSYQYDKAGNITQLTNAIWDDGTSKTKTDTQSFSYDHLNRLLTAQASGDVANYTHSQPSNDCNYDQIGNITYLGNNTAYDYQNWSAYCDLPDQELPHAVKQIGSQYFCYDNNGNMTKRFDGNTLYTQNFNVENELTSVVANNQTTSFAYDANGLRVKTVQPNGTVIDSPFPDYEVENPGLSSQTVRLTLSLAGRTIAQRLITSSSSTYYYLFTDHLGSLVAMQDSNGGLATGSTTYYYPYGDYRGTPPSQTLTNRGFTGHQSNNQPANDLGLIYMNARYYIPAIGKFASADTIVPDPANPQQFNRYTYTLNNPLRFTDPSGHNPAWCADERGNPACDRLVDFKFTGIKQWSFDEKLVIIHAATRIDFMLMLHGSSFLKVFGGTVTWTKTGTYAPEGNLGLRENQNSILVYEHDSATVISEGVRWAGHELGHAFDSALYPNTTDNLDYGQGTIDLATSNIGFTNEDGLYVQLAGGCNTHNYLTSCYIRRSGYDMGYVEENNTDHVPWEDFADMFSGYVFGFADNDAGRARYAWMDGQLSAWISLAVTNNER